MPPRNNKQLAPTYSDEFVSRWIRPISVALDRFFDCLNRAVKAGAALL